MKGSAKLLIGHKGIVNSISNRFYAKVLLPNKNGCMEWISAISPLGYGEFRVSGKNTTAHRFSYKMHYGEFPEKMHVLHKCDNRKCVSPDHLFLGTHHENMQDMIKKGRLNNGKGERAHRVKLSENDIIDIRERLSRKEKHREIAELYNVDKTTITAINLRRNWSHI